MEISNKSKISAITFVILLTTSAILIALPTAAAQEPGRKTTYPFIGATPNPVGVNQEVLLHLGITDQLQSQEWGWEGLTVTVTKPDGSIETLGPMRTDATGGTGYLFRPSMTGTYLLQTNFPEQILEVGTDWIPGGTIMEASVSQPLELKVQDNPLDYYPGHSLPTEYWGRPIDAQLREWSLIAGNWLDNGGTLGTFPYNWPYRYAPYNDAPESAHILWTKPLTTGGLVGGELGSHSMAIGDAYQGKFGSSVIINGVLYYNRYWHGFSPNFPPQQGIIAVDLRTGEELWFRNNTRLMFGQLFYWDSYNMHGTLAYIWGAAPHNGFTPVTNWDAYDAFTGELVYSMENVPIGTRVYGPKGEIFIYTANTAKGWMTMWNSSRVVSPHGSWEPDGYTYTNAAELGLEWNVTIPTDLPGTVNTVLEDRVIGSNIPGWTGLANYPITFWGLSLEPEQEGTTLFKETWQPPPGNISMLWGGSSLEDSVFVVTAKDTKTLYGFSTDTGKQVWGPTVTQPYLDQYSLGEERAIGRGVVIAKGKVFSTGMGGVVHCLDAKSGQLIWNYTAEDRYSEILWSNNWPMRILFISDGKIYLFSDEHSPINPMPRGSPFICLEIEEGNEVWRIDGAFRGTEWGGSAIIGDSIIALYNSYDQRIYAIGKGPSATTVTASPKVSMLGSSVVIEGTVMDISPGTEDTALQLRFPNRVPAISDDDMNEWMKYVYMQFEIPADPTGVDVYIDVVNPDGTWSSLGTVTSDMSGMFSLQWTPEAEGLYKIVVTFMGSGGYYASFAETAIGVDPAPTPSGPITPEIVAPLITT